MAQRKSAPLARVRSGFNSRWVHFVEKGKDYKLKILLKKMPKRKKRKQETKEIENMKELEKELLTLDDSNINKFNDEEVKAICRYIG